MKIHLIPILQDNYAYLLESANGEAAIVDPGESGPVIEEIERRALKLTHILNTHHHGDHVAGNTDLKKKYNAKIFDPKENKNFSFGGEEAQILKTPGHTADAICFYFKNTQAVFTGDTLFAMGCGRLFEGTAAQMWDSLQKLSALPDDTLVYCGHEYTESNGNFCLKIEPDNSDLTRRMENVRNLRAQKKPTIPSSIGLEKKTNAFLRAGSAERFSEIRRLKDQS